MEKQAARFLVDGNAMVSINLMGSSVLTQKSNINNS
jgi:hypothetical protein